MTAGADRTPGFAVRRSAPRRRWSQAPIIDGHAVVRPRTGDRPAGFPSRPQTSRSTSSHASQPGGASEVRADRNRPRTLLWTAPAGLVALGILFGLAFLAAPDRPVAEPLTKAELRSDGRPI